jgi:hypothetical protein
MERGKAGRHGLRHGSRHDLRQHTSFAERQEGEERQNDAVGQASREAAKNRKIATRTGRGMPRTGIAFVA